MDIESGHGFDALFYSKNHEVIAIAMNLGTEARHSKTGEKLTPEVVGRAIADNVFHGETEASIAVFVGRPIAGSANFGCSVYIRGSEFKNDYLGKTVLPPSELSKSSGQIVDKFRNPNRAVNKDNIGITELVNDN